MLRWRRPACHFVTSREAPVEARVIDQRIVANFWRALSSLSLCFALLLRIPLYDPFAAAHVRELFDPVYDKMQAIIDVKEVITKFRAFIFLDSKLKAEEYKYEEALAYIQRFLRALAWLLELKQEFMEAKKKMDQNAAEEEEKNTKLVKLCDNILEKKSREGFLQIKPEPSRKNKKSSCSSSRPSVHWLPYRAVSAHTNNFVGQQAAVEQQADTINGCPIASNEQASPSSSSSSSTQLTPLTESSANGNYNNNKRKEKDQMSPDKLDNETKYDTTTYNLVLKVTKPSFGFGVTKAFEGHKRQKTTPKRRFPSDRPFNQLESSAKEPLMSDFKPPTPAKRGSSRGVEDFFEALFNHGMMNVVPTPSCSKNQFTQTTHDIQQLIQCSSTSSSSQSLLGQLENQQLLPNEIEYPLSQQQQLPQTDEDNISIGHEDHIEEMDYQVSIEEMPPSPPHSEAGAGADVVAAAAAIAGPTADEWQQPEEEYTDDTDALAEGVLKWTEQ